MWQGNTANRTEAEKPVEYGVALASVPRLHGKG